mmetsp:Transcript_25225/g.58766  ORF Transcript_25225/g.58766 Transcript_25225/m.58766 type:complete len:489 (-) Transcript_25225:104-1570(-)
MSFKATWQSCGDSSSSESSSSTAETSTEEDAALSDMRVPPSCAVTLVHVLFAQVGQALMSFDGGATQMSQTVLLEHGWSQSMLGLLGAMDKFGQTLCAPLWGPLLRGRHVKWLVSTGFFLKALSCAGFGLLASQPMMLGCKFGMGAFEALVGIWAVGWIDSHAPDAVTRGLWQGNLSISAGIGNGVGAAVAGICGTRLGYAFAFVLQAALLMCVCTGTLFTPRALLQEKSKEEVSTKPFLEEAAGILSNSLWLFTLLSLCFSIFVQTGVGYMWQTTTKYVWGFSDVESVASLLLVTGVGGFIGTQVGPEMIKKHVGSWQDDIQGIHRCLRAFTKVTLAIGVCGTVCALALLQKVYNILDANIPQQAWGPFLAAVVVFLFLMVVLLQSMAGTLTSIMIDKHVVPCEAKSIAIGLSQAIQNVVGYAGGMVSPSLLADYVRDALDQDRPTTVILGASAATGMSLTLGSGWVLYLLMNLAACRAQKRVQGQE